MLTREELQAQHPGWTGEQIDAELARLQTEPDPEPTPDPEPASPSQEAFARLRREKQEADKRAKAAEQKLADQARLEAEQAGQWETLAKQYETERDQARHELTDLQARAKVEQAARNLKFRNADEALALLAADVDRTDDTAVTDALTALAAERPHLLDTGRPGPSGLPASGDPQPGGLTIEQVKEMTPEQINANWPEVQKALAGQAA